MNLGLWGSISPKTILGAIRRGAGGASDTTAPTVAITSTETSPTVANPIPLTITFSEIVTGFEVGDITVTGCTLSGFAGSGTTYTVNAIPTGASITVDIAQGVAVDAAGNTNTAAPQYTITSSILFYDAFTTNEATPITSPRNTEGGIAGSWTVTQTAGVIEIVSSKLQVTGPGAGAGSGTQLLGDQVFSPSAGRAVVFDRTSGNVNADVGWINTFSEVTGIAMANSGRAYVANAAAGTFLGLMDSYAAVYGAGTASQGYCKFLGKTGSTWKLLYVKYGFQRNNHSPLIRSTYNTGQVVIDNYKIIDLGSAWQTDYGIVTARVASPADNETITATADGLFEFTWTAATGATLNFYFRRTDDDNTMIVRLVQADAKVYLYKRASGVETEWGATGGIAQTLTNGTQYRIMVVADGADIRVYVADAIKQNYATADYNLSATGVKVSGFATGTNLVAWPRTVTPF